MVRCLLYLKGMSTFEKQIDQIRSFHRGELAAVESYRRAMRSVPEAHVRDALAEPMASHAKRAAELGRRIVEMGGTPDESAGPWGTFVDAVDTCAEVFGAEAVLSTLVTGERHGTADYSRDLKHLSPVEGDYVANVLLPEQRRTEQLVLSIQNDLARSRFVA